MGSEANLVGTYIKCHFMVMKSDSSANGLEGYMPNRANTALEWQVCWKTNQNHHHSFPEWCEKKERMQRNPYIWPKYYATALVLILASILKYLYRVKH